MWSWALRAGRPSERWCLEKLRLSSYKSCGPRLWKPSHPRLPVASGEKAGRTQLQREHQAADPSSLFSQGLPMGWWVRPAIHLHSLRNFQVDLGPVSTKTANLSCLSLVWEESYWTHWQSHTPALEDFVGCFCFLIPGMGVEEDNLEEESVR